MTTALRRARDTIVTNPPTNPLTCHTCKGIVTAAALLSGATLLLTGPFHLHRSSDVLVYLLIVGVTAWIGSVYAAAAGALGAALLVDYYFTPPLFSVNPLNPEMVVFFAAAFAASALSAFASHLRRSCAAPDPVDVAATADACFYGATGSRRWSAVYQAPDGRLYAIHGTALDDQEAAQQLADGVHGLTCPGCDRCGSAVVT